jgi:hypothetical protein
LFHHISKVVALFATILQFWGHFLPTHFFHLDLSGGAFCRHFAILVALSATTFIF